MEKYAVTRTFSIGAISGGAGAPEGLPGARRHSSAGIRALLWAAGGARSFSGSTDSQTSVSRENLCPNVLTPGSIPQFTIPSLCLQQSGPRAPDKEDQEDSVSPPSSSSSSSSSSLVRSERKAERCSSDPLAKRRPRRDPARFCPDPALSLPHLATVTTPYGFVTLSQSPQMASEEALLCQSLRRSNPEEQTPRGHARDPETNPRNSPDSQTEAQGGSASASTTPRQPEKLKRRFYHIIKRHFI
ncbi:uncharacterized protein ACNS7B_003913 [Menidia menidia]